MSIGTQKWPLIGVHKGACFWQRTSRDRGGQGRRPVLSQEPLAALKAVVIEGPDAARDGVVRWRCANLQGWLAQQFGISVHERTVGKLLRRAGLTRPQPRPYHSRKDAEAQAAFKKLVQPASRQPAHLGRQQAG